MHKIKLELKKHQAHPYISPCFFCCLLNKGMLVLLSTIERHSKALTVEVGETIGKSLLSGVSDYCHVICLQGTFSFAAAHMKNTKTEKKSDKVKNLASD